MPKISELPVSSNLVGPEKIILVQDSTSKSVTLSEVMTFLHPGESSTTVSSSAPTGGTNGDIWYQT